MPIRPLESWEEVGRRIAHARTSANLSQTELAAALGIDRTAVSKLEAGSRALPSLELAHLASALNRPIEWFVSESPQAVVSRRAEYADKPDGIGVPIDAFARDIELLLEVKALQPVARDSTTLPQSVNEAEESARLVRKELGRPDGPLPDLAAVVGHLGLHALSVELPDSTADGAYVALEGAGAAVVSGTQPAGRRRFTLAHELGHHVMEDEYSTDWAVGESRDERESRINAFAIHFLMPRASVHRDWGDFDGEADARSAAIRLGVEYRVSWSAVCSQLVNLGALDRDAALALRSQPPSKADHLELGALLVEELAPPYVSPLFARAALRAYRTGKIGENRTLELLRGTLGQEDLPTVDVVPPDALKGELS